NQKKAGAILNRVLPAQPDHPGVAHYLIHSFDYPELAGLALPAARSYSKIAESSPHALHMPSHIVVRLGLWDDSIRANRDSAAAGAPLARGRGCPTRRRSRTSPARWARRGAATWGGLARRSSGSRPCARRPSTRRLAIGRTRSRSRGGRPPAGSPAPKGATTT